MGNTAYTPPGLAGLNSTYRLAEDPLRYLVGVQNAYGGRYPFVRLDPPVGQSVTIVTDAELVHEVLADRDRFRRPGGTQQERRRNGLLSSEGQLWEAQRSVLEPEFVGGQLASYADTIGHTADDLLGDWPEQGTVDLFTEMSLLTVRVITQTLFSQDISRQRGTRVKEALEVLGRETEFGARDFLLPDRLQSDSSEELDAANDLLDEIATDFVDCHRDHPDPPQDMLTALMEAQADPGTDLAENELVDETVLFMTAGQETTALTLTYAFYWLSRAPEAYQRVQAEASEVLDGARPTWADLPELTYTERVVRETLRLTPAAWNIAREPRQRLTLAGTEFETDELLIMSPYAHHRDRRAWDAPGTFRPERWGETASRGQDTYFPFGSGPRVCIGRQIALTEAQFTLAHLLQHYDVETTTDELSFRPGITLRPDRDIEATVQARSAELPAPAGSD